jgi:hypothetical protein
MKKLVFLFGLLAIVSLACSIQRSQPTQKSPEKSDEVATLVAATLQAIVTPPPAQQPTTEPATVVPAEPTSPAPSFEGKAVTVGNVSLMLPNGLATAASGVQIPAADEQSAAPWDVAPAHVEITLDGYPSQSNMFKPKLYVYPMLDYATAHQGAAESIKRLQSILSNPASVTPETLPGVPFFNAAQMFAAQINVLKFQNGAGVRMVTAYGQAAGEITSDMTFYHFEGLTSDNKFYIIAILPMQVPATNVQFPGYDAQPDALEQYYKAVSANFNAAAPSEFNPNLTALDALVQSIQVAP